MYLQTDGTLPHLNAGKNYATRSKISYKETIKTKYTVRSFVYWCFLEYRDLWKDWRLMLELMQPL